MPIASPPTPVHPPRSSAPQIRADLFPARVTSPDGSVIFTHDNARVIITEDSLFIFVDSPGGPALAVNARLDEITGDRKTGYTARYASPGGNPAVLQFSPSGGCGCGSRLRSFTPWTPMRYAASRL